MHPHDVDALVRAARDPGRRRFLRLGGGAVLGAAALAACGGDDGPPPAETGTTVSTTGTTLAPPRGTTPEEGRANDAVVTRTARSLELAAVAVYDVLVGDQPETTDPDAMALPQPITYGDDVRATLELLRERHAAHAELLSDLVAQAGGAAVTEANQGILDGLLAPELAGLTSQEAVVGFAGTIEDLSAATHTWAAGTLSTPELRQEVMAVGAVLARQAAVVAALLDPTGETVVEGAVLDTSGPARIPEHMLLTDDDMDGGDVSADADAAPAPDDGGEGEGDDEAEDEGAGG